jgi:hypothetical protein
VCMFLGVHVFMFLGVRVCMFVSSLAQRPAVHKYVQACLIPMHVWYVCIYGLNTRAHDTRGHQKKRPARFGTSMPSLF